MTPGTTDKSEGSLRSRLGWFVLLWAAGLAVVGGLTYLLRAALNLVFPS